MTGEIFPGQRGGGLRRNSAALREFSAKLRFHIKRGYIIHFIRDSHRKQENMWTGKVKEMERGHSLIYFFPYFPLTSSSFKYLWMYCKSLPTNNMYDCHYLSTLDLQIYSYITCCTHALLPSYACISANINIQSVHDSLFHAVQSSLCRPDNSCN